MRAPTVLAAIALAGTVLLGGAGQALAYDNDDMSSAGVDFGSNSQGGSDAEESKSEFDQDASGFGQAGSVFDPTSVAND
ncbi:hypothetical protein J7F01_09485 [Streptomyces sp. ISL-22]|uniref:hypothetical protein n=1 Tax=unclassified Streptomyces TaxID=2593676 RepID=UPI001BE978C6|nr:MULTISPECIES: hypothetical protein [unclassified Streptomyces]MBT2416743.1 hypothetical protein [Streptomyces sp. ISL-24]MBT2432432.1 hypothetical protein [Streptomyces sp. ISL-22]